MSVALSYLGFHAVFILPPILALGWVAIHREDAWFDRRSLSGLGIIVFLAVVYTTPWTNAMIPEGVWWYGDGAVVDRVWYTPVEEYLFFVLQPILTAFWLFQFLSVSDRSLRIPLLHRAIGASAGLAICAGGWLLMQSTGTFYLGSILLWAGPILAIQWGFGLTYLRDVWPTVLVGVGVPTLYLWVADRIAIGLGVWEISTIHTVGLTLFGLPIEEALFFLVTNVFVVQGVVMYVWVLDRRHELVDLASLSDRPRYEHAADEH